MAPKQMEFLKDPDFTVAVALRNERSQDVFNRFVDSVAREYACFEPVLGLHNCPAELALLAEGDFGVQNGSFTTKGFAGRQLRLDRTNVDLSNFRVGFERIPTYQNDDFWNLPDRYVEVVYPSNGREIALTGEHCRFTGGEAWWLT